MTDFTSTQSTTRRVFALGYTPFGHLTDSYGAENASIHDAKQRSTNIAEVMAESHHGKILGSVPSEILITAFAEVGRNLVIIKRKLLFIRILIRE